MGISNSKLPLYSMLRPGPLLRPPYTYIWRPTTNCTVITFDSARNTNLSVFLFYSLVGKSRHFTVHYRTIDAGT